MEDEKIEYPAEFFVIGQFSIPVRYSFLCEFPAKPPKNYAVYLNNQTKQPERIFVPNIKEVQKDLVALLKHERTHLYSLIEQVNRNIEDAQKKMNR